ncbi:head-tail connector protein [Lysinibacillus sp. TE18511]
MAVDLLNTKFSDIDLEFAKSYMHIESDFTEDDIQIQLMINSAKGFVITYSKLTAEELDEMTEMTIPYLKLISDLYHERTAMGKEDFSQTCNIILNLHRLPSL